MVLSKNKNFKINDQEIISMFLLVHVEDFQELIEKYEFYKEVLAIFQSIKESLIKNCYFFLDCFYVKDLI